MRNGDGEESKGFWRTFEALIEWRAFSWVMKDFRHRSETFCKAGWAEEGRKGLAGIMKYYRHISEGFCERRAKGGRRAFTGIMKYFRCISEGFCKGDEIL